ncbi:hypothetical protein EVAR_21124_1 [Eumeta japonica]|uniref:Uncharacterized protein n=1 Tax=Eumeta variegata TaxID=151549 RepID=A0A4C1VUC7_EUMVA|nr:hypothetical protein EVAR_21124_1 [Eumeta japonica]
MHMELKCSSILVLPHIAEIIIKPLLNHTARYRSSELVNRANGSNLQHKNTMSVCGVPPEDATYHDGRSVHAPGPSSADINGCVRSARGVPTDINAAIAPTGRGVSGGAARRGVRGPL